MIGCKGIPVEAGLSGGIERAVEELSKRLVERGHAVTVYVRPYANPSRRKVWEGVRLVTVFCLRLRYVETATHVFLSTLRALFGRYDVIHYHGVGPSTFAWMPRLFSPRTKVVVTFHVRDQFHELRHPIARAYLRWGEWTAVRFPHVTIAVSKIIREFCLEEFGVDAVYIPNAVSVPAASAVRSDRLEPLGLKPNSYFLSIGRLVQFKAFDVAVRAFKDVGTEMPFVIAGAAGYDRAYTKKLARIAGADPRVRLVGFRSGEDLSQLVAHAYAVIHPSRVEGMPMGVLEAMSYGKLVILSDIPEHREIADHSAVCVRGDDVAELREAMAWAIQDPAMVQARGIRARAYVTERHAWGPVVKATEEVYRAAA